MDTNKTNAKTAIATSQYYDDKWASAPTEPTDDEHLRLVAIDHLIRRARLPTQAMILDYGCGRGWLAPHLAEWGEVVAVDFSPNAIKSARATFGGSAKFVLAQPDDPGFLGLDHDARFDLIVSTEVIEHTSDPLAFMHGIRGLIRSTGACILTTPNRHLWPRYRQLSSRLQPVENWLTPAQLSRLLRDAGFRVVSHVGIPVPYHPANRLPLLQRPKVLRLSQGIGFHRLLLRALLRYALYQVCLCKPR